MKFKSLYVTLGVFLASHLACAAEIPDSPSGNEVYVVDFYDGQEAAGNEYLQELATENKIEILEVLGALGDAIIQAPESEVLNIMQHDSVKVVEGDEEMDVMGWVDEVQPESLRGRGRTLAEETPYGIAMVKAADLPNLPASKSWKKVCVVDTGYENSHPDLPTLATGDGFSPYGSSQLWNVDGSGHGTHCAGTIGAIGDNNAGVDSVMNTYGSGFENFFIGKGLTNGGSGSWSGVISAMNACETNGASVISMSLGGSSSGTSFRDAAKTLHEKGILLIAAAGNRGNSALSYPASYDHVMSVAAVDSSRRRASFSQFNSQVEISGPGVSVKSTHKDGSYKYLSGTSMATPHVAGVAGLVWSHFPDCSPMQIRYAMSKTAAKGSGQSTCDTRFGHGIVDAKATYDYLASNACSSNSWPDKFKEKEYVEKGCYASDNDTPSPTNSPTPSPVTPPPSNPAPATCSSWCSDIPETDIPWNATNTGELSKCDTVKAHCGGCSECPAADTVPDPELEPTQIPGTFKFIATSGDKNHIWALKSNDDIYYRNGPDGVWTKIPGRLVNIAVSNDGKHVWGVNRYDNIYYRNGKNGRWIYIPGRLKWISVDATGNRVWGANAGGNVYYRNGKNGRWVYHSSQKLKQVDVSGDGKHQWGVSPDGKVYHKSGISPSGQFTEMSGPTLKQISINYDGNHLWAVDDDEVIYYRNGASGSWKAVGGGMGEISVAAVGNYFVGNNPSDLSVWRVGADLNKI